MNANSLFITCVITGTVGSATRALWQELIQLADVASLKVWPFHGPLDSLLQGRGLVIAEIYPKACYGIALAESLPAPLTRIAKTQPAAREHSLAALQSAAWVSTHRLPYAN